MEKITNMTESMELDGENKTRKKKSGRIPEVNTKEHNFFLFLINFYLTPAFPVFMWVIYLYIDQTKSSPVAKES